MPSKRLVLDYRVRFSSLVISKVSVGVSLYHVVSIENIVIHALNIIIILTSLIKVLTTLILTDRTIAAD